MKSNVALIGFMGVGKTAIGKGLAERLGKKLVQTDVLIELMAGKTITRIFQEDGEIAFREMEIDVIRKAAAEKNQVIDCGGGVVLNRINIERLKIDSVIVWLTASNDIVLKRTAPDKIGRPLLQGNKSLSDMEKIISFREPLYAAAADIKIDTSKLNIFSVEEKIAGKLKEYANSNK
jgi:shikimate kinase